MREAGGQTVSVNHGSYDCDTGCCGHYVTVRDASGAALATSFTFAHPDGAPPQRFAQHVASEHFPGVPLCWEACSILDS